MSFGLWNAPATFELLVSITLSMLTWKVCLAYPDDIIVFSRDLEEHMEHLDTLLHRLYRAGLSLNLKSVSFSRSSRLSRPCYQSGKLAVAEKNTNALKTAKPPVVTTGPEWDRAYQTGVFGYPVVDA